MHETPVCRVVLRNKKSLKERLDISKTFVLIVGKNTKTVTKGGCQYCDSYNSHIKSCARMYPVDYRSFIEYECDVAVRDKLKIIVLYKAAIINSINCPDALKNVGTHAAMCYRENGQLYWDYAAVKKAFEDAEKAAG